MSDTLQVAIEGTRTAIKDTTSIRHNSGLSREAELEIQRALRGLRFGSLEIIVHDSNVVQIERREKTRFVKPGGSNGHSH